MPARPSAFLRRGLRFVAGHGVRVELVMSDNGVGYVSLSQV